MNLLEHIIGTLAPHLCLGCAREGTTLCEACLQTLPPPPRHCYLCERSSKVGICRVCQPVSSLRHLHAATIYTGVAAQVVHKLKFERASAAATPIARSISMALDRAQYDIVLPVPTANQRIRRRGYDQAVLITRAVGRFQNHPYLPLLVRLGKQRQLGQNRTVRRRQLEDAFWVRTPKKVRHKRVLIIDDVLTTGSTIEAAARSLRQAGAAEVSAAVFAVVPRDKTKRT